MGGDVVVMNPYFLIFGGGGKLFYCTSNSWNKVVIFRYIDIKDSCLAEDNHIGVIATF